MRLDLYLVNNSYTESRQKAQRLIKNSCISVDGRILTKASEEIDENTEHTVEIVKTDDEKYVSRGGLKLEGALDAFGVSPEGMVCADIGASTGGFTDCLLQNGAVKVYAFDSGRDQLHSSLATDKRVISKEGFNARYITLDDIGESVDLVVMDVSFISQTMIIPSIVKLLKSGGSFVTLIKPQFEAGRSALGKNGIVKRREDRLTAVMRVLECAELAGLSFEGLIKSPIKGGDGNEEFLAYFKLCEGPEIKHPIASEIKKTVFGQ